MKMKDPNFEKRLGGLRAPFGCNKIKNPLGPDIGDTDIFDSWIKVRGNFTSLPPAPSTALGSPPPGESNSS